MPAAKSPSSEGSGKAPSRNKSRRSAARKAPVLKPLDVVLLTRERIQATLDEAAERGRVTRSDANDLVSELFKRGRQQTDDLFAELEGRLVRRADRARRTVGAGLSVGSAFPIADYDELTVAEVEAELPGLTAPQLRKIRDYERSHANRKSVLAAVEKLLDRGP